MARFKPARGKAKLDSPNLRAGLPCLIIVIAAMILTMTVMYYALKSGGS